MSILITATAFLLATPVLADRIQPEKCRDETARTSGMRVAKPRRLGEMPPATQFKAVRNLVDGCPKPVVVRRDVGATTGPR